VNIVMQISPAGGHNDHDVAVSSRFDQQVAKFGAEAARIGPAAGAS
jgi:hypothetical protein